jgi:hypothetical protein
MGFFHLSLFAAFLLYQAGVRDLALLKVMFYVIFSYGFVIFLGLLFSFPFVGEFRSPPSPGVLVMHIETLMIIAMLMEPVFMFMGFYAFLLAIILWLLLPVTMHLSGEILKPVMDWIWPVPLGDAS